MHVHAPQSELARPNICTICETKPEDARMVDTGLNNSYIPPTPLTGRKYVCEYCVKHLATALNYVPMAMLNEATAHNAEIWAERDALAEKLRQFESGAVEQLMNLVAPRDREPVEAPIDYGKAVPVPRKPRVRKAT